jgi:hypothetical protein
MAMMDLGGEGSGERRGGGMSDVGLGPCLDFGRNDGGPDQAGPGPVFSNVSVRWPWPAELVVGRRPGVCVCVWINKEGERRH